MSRPTILLTHTPEDLRLFYDPEALERLRSLGRVVTNSADHHLSPRELLQAARGCHVIISEWGTGADGAVFAEAKDLVAFIRSGVEMRNVNIAAASAHGVLVVNTPGLYVTAVVELVLALMICLARDVVNRCILLRAGTRPANRFGTELCGKTVGLIGYGEIGRAVARATCHLGMRVLFTDPYVTSDDSYATGVALDRLLGEADFVSVHAKWTPETEDLIEEATFRKMKPTAFFINTARGALVDETALLRALRDGWIAGAALDVFGNEPEVVGNPLLDLPNVIATPHIGGITPETMKAQAARTVAIVQDILAGKVPEGAVNADEVPHPRLERLRDR